MANLGTLMMITHGPHVAFHVPSQRLQQAFAGPVFLQDATFTLHLLTRSILQSSLRLRQPFT